MKDIFRFKVGEDRTTFTATRHPSIEDVFIVTWDDDDATPYYQESDIKKFLDSGDWVAIDKDVLDKGEVSDGYHTFNELYYHRMMLFAVICNTYKDKAWKSWKHHDGTMYEDYFIVGVTTDKGDYTYHYHSSHWDTFDVKELDNAPKWDGHKPEDIARLMSLLINKTSI